MPAATMLAAVPEAGLETVAAIRQAYHTGVATPAEIVARSYARLRACDDTAMFIAVRDEEDALAEARRVARGDRDLPLLGIPVAVKDNIDVRGLPTTAGCPDFRYHPDADATAVARLIRAGAIVIGKTNLDQFATGLVGVRSPYGVPRNPLNARLIPGGSSSGSAVAVAAGIVPLALGTDTAGSGRIPALFNGIVGLKPSLGLVSTAGVVPACRTLDCVSILAHTVDDCAAALAVIAAFDARDPYSRRRPLPACPAPDTVRVGVPPPRQRMFLGAAQDADAALYAQALDRLAGLGADLVEVDVEPLHDAGRLLYEGPWLAERYAALRDFITASPHSLHAVTRKVILAGARPSAADAFAAFYRLADLRRRAEEIFAAVDVLAVPTAPTSATLAEVAAEPLAVNARLGTYTHFVNLLDMCAVAVPAAVRHDDAGGTVPFGITLLAAGGNDGVVGAVAAAFQAAAMPPSCRPAGGGKTPHKQPAEP